MTDRMNSIKEYILKEFLPGEDPNDLTDSTQLFTTGLLDSIASLNLVSFLEEEYGVKVEPHEIVADNLDTIKLIADFVEQKKAAA